MYPRNNYSFFIIYIFFLPAPVRMTVPSSTSFLSADSTEELPRLGRQPMHHVLKTFQACFPNMSLQYHIYSSFSPTNPCIILSASNT